MELNYKLHRITVDAQGNGLFHKKGMTEATRLELLLVCIGRISPLKEHLLISSINQYFDMQQSGAPTDESTPTFVLRTVRAFAEVVSLYPDEQDNDH